MKNKYIVVSMGLALASSSFVANANWDSSSANATVTADVLNQLTVSAPTNGNNGALGKVLIDTQTKAQLDFNVEATKGYELQFQAIVLDGCQDIGDAMGEDGAVVLDEPDAYNMTPTQDDFMEPVHYTYHSPKVAKIGAECMVNLAATYM
ncbi:hypothetical protein AB4393_06975 [Vibrio splendidus]|uniref:hypothetical protein n=1 Tax=Vibrio splendidus TaxID=29497 RepID=UPI0009756DD0|nr:hypothetical protein [Vibrio splendidus]OMO19614.1 hypothetical protein BH581_05805 [Vibrio splendidus]PMG27893.1 hypothetical protein BCU97_22525 [Vibrio splendidus]PMH07767.1 hypothetical protein BCU75_18595 [Vibrio splendidus]|tara:strand:- start:5869 stop:6318 length:450 start_codon:yes stop_codon:yes gene_type:complete